MKKLLTLIEFKILCDCHDWYYERSEDPREYDKGTKDREYLESIMREGGEEYRKIYFSYQR
jgi:hypothetical protein